MNYKKHPEADIKQVKWKGNTYPTRYIEDYAGGENLIGDEELSQAIQENPEDRELINIDNDIIFFEDRKSLFELSNAELCADIFANCEELEEFDVNYKEGEEEEED